VGAGNASADALSAALRSLPAVERLAAALDAPPALAVPAARAAIDARRAELRAGAAPEPDETAALAARATRALERAARPSPRRVLNATGVIVHTNLGRAPLASAAREAVVAVAEGYCDLELDLESGERGSRQDHVEGLLRELTGAEAALAVNNCAAAVLLAAAALAGPGRSIVVSRGQLVEIGGGFRVPDVIAQSGSRLVEVGTTNRTRPRDYERALAAEGEAAGAILRAHPSNFRMLGFVEEVAIETLCGFGVPVIDDLGSGLLATGPGPLADEPPVRRSVAAGAALVCFSADKLLGGPQGGLIVGREDAVARAREHPLARAARIDKLSLAALQATLRLHRDPELARQQVPVAAMLAAGEEVLSERARRLRDAALQGGRAAEVVRGCGRAGGGALPLAELEGPVVAIAGPDPDALAAALRAGDPALVGRVSDGRLVLDPRTLLGEAEVAQAARALAAALAET